MTAITRATVRAAAKAALNRYLPGFTVLVGQRWPVVTPQLQAVLLLRTGNEVMRATSRSAAPSFDIAMPLHVHARVAVAPNPATPPGQSAHGEAIEAAVDRWAEDLREALLGDADFAPFVGNGSGQVEIQIGEEADEVLVDVAFTVECQWQATFPPRDLPPLSGVTVRLDAIEPFDAAGAYPATPPFPAPAPAPREAGPDGRAEAGFDLTLPNT